MVVDAGLDIDVEEVYTLLPAKCEVSTKQIIAQVCVD